MTKLQRERLNRGLSQTALAAAWNAWKEGLLASDGPFEEYLSNQAHLTAELMASANPRLVRTEEASAEDIAAFEVIGVLVTHNAIVSLMWA